LISRRAACAERGQIPGRGRREAAVRPAVRPAALEADWIEYTFGFSGVITPENPKASGQAHWIAPEMTHDLLDSGGVI
jgi:hypothetical protein